MSSLANLVNHQIRLAARPVGMPKPTDWSDTTEAVAEPLDGGIVVKTLALSLDPAMRGWMNEGKSYIPPVGIGEVMRAGGVGKVIASKSDQFAVGDLVSATLGVQEYVTLAADEFKRNGIFKIDQRAGTVTQWLNVLGMPGMTGYFGLMDVGLPKAGETVVVSGAAGAVGQTVGQIAKIKGCRVVGIAGGPKKCAFVKDELGFDACLDYKAEKDLDTSLRAACPNGIDVYFDNVGGTITDSVLRNLNFFARVALCGSISQYNATAAEMGPRLFGTFVGKRVNMRGFIVTDFAQHYGPAMRQIGEWIRSGKLKYREDIVDGIDKAPRAFIGLLRGENFGKLLVKMA